MQLLSTHLCVCMWAILSSTQASDHMGWVTEDGLGQGSANYDKWAKSSHWLCMAQELIMVFIFLRYKHTIWKIKQTTTKEEFVTEAICGPQSLK